jgi:hypothetical protein
VNTVYFAVPNYFFETYGTLQKIKAEWYEFETKDIFVINTKVNEDVGDVGQTAYNFFKSHLGEYYPGEMGSVYVDPYDTGKDRVFGFTSPFDDVNIFDDVKWTIDWGINASGRKVNYREIINYMYWLFETKQPISEYDPEMDVTENGGISSNAFEAFPYAPLSIDRLTVLSIRQQRDDNGNRTLREWPTGIGTHKSMAAFYIGSNDLRRIDDTISPYILLFEIKDNPNISIDLSNVCPYIEMGYYELIYDSTQDIRGCDALNLD